MKSLIPILVVEDNDDDRILLQRAFHLAGIENPLHLARDGQEALDYLSCQGEYRDRSVCEMPGILLLDIKLPKVSGFEVLQMVRTTPELKTLIVMVITSSNQPADIYRAYDLGANAYFIKPGTFQELLGFAKVLKSYWLEVNNIAPQRAG